ncbi:quinone-dependent dihydroorotate dehydrogenase [Marinicella gelatinilytica]|uniref:quinone-dependent dihydroorotate dehydrogenase n=1 Tax=Marinicella gelatinilytica TaxID=2996017 RepID=UPI002260AE2C|nr:quinone-dependent dihydroorotate dehydrogenase [Marinicella gelatinilytica]MCX7543822.1 quinone-dependent dihydroorotate dehydrogenase [Marinicella gelatinilytica]
MIISKLYSRLLQQLPAETAHDMAIHSLGSPLAKLAGCAEPAAPVKLMGIQFPGRVGLAAGFDKNADAVSGLSRLGFGFLEVGTVTPKPQSGNHKPRLFRLKQDRAIINRMGFNNKGVDYLVKQIKNTSYQGVLGINIGKNKDTDNSKALDDYLIGFNKTHSYADYVTINISSPNTPNLRALQSEHSLNQLLSGLKEAQFKAQQQSGQYTPLVVKISPDEDQQQLIAIAGVLQTNEIDGLICTNTTISRPDTLISNQQLIHETGGLSGAPLKHKSFITLKTMRQLLGTDFPIIAVGGIMGVTDAQQRFDCGADLIQIYTGFVYQGPTLINNINAWLTQTHVTSP